jgi:hypothetical protein
MTPVSKGCTEYRMDENPLAKRPFWNRDACHRTVWSVEGRQALFDRRWQILLLLDAFEKLLIVSNRERVQR